MKGFMLQPTVPYDGTIVATKRIQNLKPRACFPLCRVVWIRNSVVSVNSVWLDLDTEKSNYNTKFRDTLLAVSREENQRMISGKLLTNVAVLCQTTNPGT